MKNHTDVLIFHRLFATSRSEMRNRMNVAEMTKRINELYHKSQAEGLTDEEKTEQASLRQAYAANVRANLRGQLDNISIVEKDGSVTHLRDKNREKNHGNDET